MKDRYNILIVDDNEDNRYSLRKILHQPNYDFREAHDGPSALAAFRQEAPDLVLLDVRMPGIDGFEVCATLRQLSPHVPIVFVTANVKDFTAQVQGFEKGGDDYLIQPYEPAELAIKVKAFLRNKSLYDDLVVEIGKLERLRNDLSSSNDELKRVNSVLAERNRFLDSLSLTDPVTSLYNRKYFHQRLKKELSAVQRYKQESAVALLDIDHFTRFNELHGRTQGDVLLKEVAGLLVGRVRGSDVVMRYDGGRFVVLFTHTPELQALTKAKILQEQIAQYSFSVYDESLEGGLRITASLAVTGLGHPWLRAEPDVMKSLESALGEVKQHGPGQLTTGIPV